MVIVQTGRILRQVSAKDVIEKARLRDRPGGNNLGHVARRSSGDPCIGMSKYRVGEEKKNLPDRHMKTIVVAQFEQGTQAVSEPTAFEEFELWRIGHLGPNNSFSRGKPFSVRPIRGD